MKTRFLLWKPGFSLPRRNPVSKAETGFRLNYECLAINLAISDSGSTPIS